MEEPYTFDLVRIFVGDFPPMIFVEILLRTALMYLYTFMLMRILGKRESGALSPFELVIVISLGSAVGDPMFYPDVPLLHGFAVISTIVFLQYSLQAMNKRNPSLERWVEGKPRLLVRDGIIDLHCLDHERISTQELYSALRSKNVTHLGEVYRAYFEPSGDIAVIKADRPQPGLSLLPKDDPDVPRPYRTGDVLPKPMVMACRHCGTTTTLPAEQPLPRCPHCHKEIWTEAVVTEKG